MDWTYNAKIANDLYEDFCERYILVEEDWELLSGERLVVLLKFLSYSSITLKRRS